MKFKTGDKVKVREDLVVGQDYGDQTFVTDMNKYKGKIYTISSTHNGWYSLAEHNEGWFFTDEMLKPAEKMNPEQFKKEQVKRIKKENEKNCDTCRFYESYFDCSQCSDFDEWQEIKPYSLKNCTNCKHHGNFPYCSQCKDHDEWEKKEIEECYPYKKERKMKIILLSGKARSGKDSAANMMKSKLEAKGKKVLIAHYGDLIKYTCKTFFDWNGEKDEQGRTLLQEIGTDRIRAKSPNFWVNYIRDILSIFENEWDYVLIPDTRFPNEINHMKNYFNDVISVCVVRTNFISPLTKEQQNHKSETALDDYIFDYYLIADNLEKLERKVDVFLEDKLCN